MGESWVMVRCNGEVVRLRRGGWPGLERLWRHADSVTVRAGHLRMSPSQTGKLLGEARGTGKIDMTAASVRVGPLILTDVSLNKRGDLASAQGQVSEANVRAALPAGVFVQLVSSEAGEVRVRVDGALFGVGASLDAVAQPRAGK